MRIKINLQIFIFMAVFILTKQIEIYAYLMIFALIHELGHLFMGVLLGLKPTTLKIMPFGICIVFERYEDIARIHVKKLLVAIAGPFVNLIIATIGIIINMNLNIIYSNILIAIFNFLPIYPLDGGRILKEILNLKYPTTQLQGIIMKVSNITLLLLSCAVSILVLYIKNLGLIFVIIYMWFLVINENKKYTIRKRVYNIIKNT